MKLIHKPTDERVAQEVNRIYKIGYYVFTFGILLDMLLQAIKYTEGSGQFSWGEFGVFMLAQIVCVVMQWRNGLMDDNAFAESDRFPLRHYLFTALGAGAIAAILLTVLRVRQFVPVEGGSSVMFGLSVAFFISICIPTALATLVIYYISFRMARRRRAQKVQELEEDEE